VNDHERTRTDPERDSPGRVRDSSRGPKQARRVINIKTHKPWPRKGTQRRWAQSARLEGEERRVEPGRLARHRAPRATLHVRGTAACARALREGSPACGARHPRAAWRQDAQQRLLGDGDPRPAARTRERGGRPARCQPTPSVPLARPYWASDVVHFVSAHRRAQAIHHQSRGALVRPATQPQGLRPPTASACTTSRGICRAPPPGRSASGWSRQPPPTAP